MLVLVTKIVESKEISVVEGEGSKERYEEQNSSPVGGFSSSRVAILMSTTRHSSIVARSTTMLLTSSAPDKTTTEYDFMLKKECEINSELNLLTPSHTKLPMYYPVLFIADLDHGTEGN